MKRSVLAILLLMLAACRRETRIITIDPVAAATVDWPSTNTICPGPTSNEIATNFTWTNVMVTNFLPKRANTQPAASQLIAFYQENAWSMSEGKRLYAMFNCVGCHGHGGGGMGPALMDQKWIYGSASEQIFVSISQGRPNGMPAFKDRIPEYLMWELVAYVRSMSGLAPMDAAPSRDDHLQMRLPENTIGVTQMPLHP
jgi:cytochrome c oxidase cbb3-type subunit 3